MNDLNELRDEIYDDAVEHGLWDEDYLLKTLVNSDVVRDSGLLQIYKIVNTEQEMRRVHATLRVFVENQELLETVLEEEEEDHFREELADVIITALSAAGYLGIDIDKAVRAKMEINRGREWRHGK